MRASVGIENTRGLIEFEGNTHAEQFASLRHVQLKASRVMQQDVDCRLARFVSRRFPFLDRNDDCSVDIDECTTTPGICGGPCLVCENGPGTYTCFVDWLC